MKPRIYCYSPNNSSQYEKYLSYVDFIDVIVLKEFDDIFKYEGFALFVDFEGTPKDFDIHYRRKLNFNIIYLYQDGINRKLSNFSNIRLINDEYMDDLDLNFIDDYNNYNLPMKTVFHHNKRMHLFDIYDYIKNKKSFTSEEISKMFNISIRSVQRYLLDLNYMTNDIGYDYSSNTYYMCK